MTEPEIITETRTCSLCGDDKPVDQFLYKRCDDCRLRLQREFNRKSRLNKKQEKHGYYSYAVGMVIGEFKGLSNYTK